MMHKEQMEELSQFSLEKGGLKGGLITVFEYKQISKKNGDQMFTVFAEDRTEGNGVKLQQGTFKLDIRYNFLTIRLVKFSNKLP